jgi:hypothetical protein
MRNDLSVNLRLRNGYIEVADAAVVLGEQGSGFGRHDRCFVVFTCERFNGGKRFPARDHYDLDCGLICSSQQARTREAFARAKVRQHPV